MPKSSPSSPWLGGGGKEDGDGTPELVVGPARTCEPVLHGGRGGGGCGAGTSHSPRMSQCVASATATERREAQPPVSLPVACPSYPRPCTTALRCISRRGRGGEGGELGAVAHLESFFFARGGPGSHRRSGLRS